MNEVWKAIPGFEDYEASNQGQIKSHKRKEPRILRAGTFMGYKFVNLSLNGKSFVRRVHQLVMLAFVGLPPNGMEVCHNNDVKDDNRSSNLRYDTRVNNRKDERFLNGGVALVASLTLKEAQKVFAYCKSHTVTETAREFDIKRVVVESVISSTSYKYLGTLSKRKQRFEEAEIIREMYATNKYTYAELGKQYNLCESSICRIVKKEIRDRQ